MGLACGSSRFATVPDESLQELEPGAVAVITQSGALCTSINRAINDVGLKLAYLVSCGNQIVCTMADYIDYLADDPLLKVILCYVEGLPDAQRFFAATTRAHAKGKVTVVVKIGGSDAGRAAALAHTGSLAGNTKAFDTMRALRGSRSPGFAGRRRRGGGVFGAHAAAARRADRGDDQFRRVAQPHHGSGGADRRQARGVFRCDARGLGQNCSTIRGSAIRSIPR